MSNSIRFPEAWKIYTECVRKWEVPNDKQYPNGLKYGIPNPVNLKEYLYSDCPGKLFIQFKNSFYLNNGIRGFRNFLWKLEVAEGKISEKEYEANLKFMLQY